MSIGITFIHRPNVRARSLKIGVDAQGQVIVTTPVHFPKMLIPQYVEQARDWIHQQQEQRVHAPVLLDSNSVMYFGMPYDFVILPYQDASVNVKLDTMEIAPVDTTSVGIISFMQRWLKARAAAQIVPRVDVLATQMQTTYNAIHLREQKTRWGSCSAEKNLNFNWRLIHAPKAVIDYVVIHELAHTVHMNHGPRFWELVTKHDPDHPLHRGWLKRFGSSED